MKEIKFQKNEIAIGDRKSGDFDVWYQPCGRCGYDTAKSVPPKEGNKTCWRCGNFVYRDYSERALKPEFKNHINACNYCDNNKSGAEQGYWCATKCISGSKFTSTETTLEELKLM